MATDAATERAIFRRACAVLAELQDDMGWADVASKFKGQAKRWQDSLDKTERQGAQLRASLLTPVRHPPYPDASLRRRASSAAQLPSTWAPCGLWQGASSK